MERVYVGISGGVDSAVAAFLLKKKGYLVTGYTMTLQGTPIKYDDAFETADSLGIELITVDVSKEFETKVLRRFVDEYKAGLTPSPCPVCNPIKFGIAEHLDREAYIATGHYAVAYKGGLYCSPHEKDQAYFLARLARPTINRLILPLGEMEKDEVRGIARQEGLKVSEKEESQDICFIAGGDYRCFLKGRGVKDEPGDVINGNGSVIDRHNGVFNYTIGQRYRLGGTAERLYVTATDPGQNIVTTGPDSDLYRNSVLLRDINRLAEFSRQDELYLKIRSVDSFHRVETVEEDDLLRIGLTQAVRAVTPGQLGVLYRKRDGRMQVCLSGWIYGSSL